MCSRSGCSSCVSLGVLKSKVAFPYSPSRVPPATSLYLHVCVDLIHRLWLMITEQTHSRDGMGPPVRPVAANDTQTSVSWEVTSNWKKHHLCLSISDWACLEKTKLCASFCWQVLNTRTRLHHPPARGRLHSEPPPRFSPVPDGRTKTWGRPPPIRVLFTL